MKHQYKAVGMSMARKKQKVEQELKERWGALVGLTQELERAIKLEKQAAGLGVLLDADFGDRQAAISAKLKRGFDLYYAAIEAAVDFRIPEA